MVTNKTDLLLPSQSLSQQKDFLEGRGTRRTLEKLYDSASLMVHRDVDSLQTFFSGTSITSSKRSVVFDFDRELFSSRIYERWIRGSVREHLQKQQNHFLASTSANRLGVPLLRGFMGPAPKPQLRPQGHVYEPLKGSWNIRLLVLFAGAGDNPLQGELTEVVLNEPREYVALSYNWDRIEMQPSQRYLQTPMGIFGLPASLHSALHCLRDPFQHRMIWVAAICVPHDNRMEWEELFKALQICVRARPRLLGDRDGSTENCECAIAAYTLGVLREAYRTTPPGIQYSLLQLLDICWYSSSSPLDKLYSLLHLASDGEQAHSSPTTHNLSRP